MEYGKLSLLGFLGLLGLLGFVFDDPRWFGLYGFFGFYAFGWYKLFVSRGFIGVIVGFVAIGIVVGTIIWFLMKLL